ncbi:hypothetical protein COOONC_19360 [Cooperia oncophora]
METNDTLLLDDLVVDVSDEFPVPSTSTFIDESPTARDLLIGDLPDVDPNNITGVTVSTTTQNHTVFENVFKTIESLLDESSWVVYTIVFFVTVLLIVITCSIVIFIVKHKKRVIQQDNDPILTSTYDAGFSWRKCLCCRTEADKQSQLQARQNSASNLDPYKRPPLPPIGVKSDGYISTFKRTDALNGLDRPSTIDEKSLAVNIQSIRGVPHIHLQPEQYRNLPPLKMRYN